MNPVAEYNPSGIEEFGEATYYHNYTEDYRITIGLLSDGRYDIAYLETANPDLIYHSVTFIEDVEQPENFEEIEKMVCDGRVDLKTMDINREVLLTRSGDDDANVIGLDLEADRESLIRINISIPYLAEEKQSPYMNPCILTSVIRQSKILH